MQTARNRSSHIHAAPEPQRSHHENSYSKLALMIIGHFFVMYALMYLMVPTWSDIFLNINNFYMSGAMAAPMAILMLLFMKRMYPNPKVNIAIYGLSTILLIGFIWFTRQQTFVNDEQFIKSMIPHHSGAILMCNRSSVTDTELADLCKKIVKAQREEIDQMKSILARIENR